MSQRLVIIDYGMGNLHSAAKAFEHVAESCQVVVSSDPQVIESADRVVLPGVGAIRDCIAELKQRGLDSVVARVFVDRPFLGICVGLQALMQHSEENEGTDCLNLLPGQVTRLQAPVGERLKVPHMGWSPVTQCQPHPIWQGIEDDSRFYFVHSYAVTQIPQALAIGQTHYGQDFASVVARQNVVAVQFHPEKSHHSGLRLLKNFATWNGQA